MTVYVDSARHPLGRMLMSHMTADNLDELHSMADQIGVARRHFQDKRLPHYDVCQAKRDDALRLGAKVVSSKEIVRVSKRAREIHRANCAAYHGDIDGDLSIW